MGGDDARDGGSTLPEPLPSPEEQELELKREELRRLHAEVVELEMKLRTLEAQVEGFVFDRLFRLGRLYEQIDELELKIAELRLARDPENPVLQRRAQEARARWERSSEAARTAEEMGAPRTIVLTAEIKALYREAARRMHPDLGRTDEEREHRHRYMVLLNAAYTSGDLEAMQDLIAAWDAEIPPPEGLGIGERLIRLIRALARHRTTRERLLDEIETLRGRADHTLMIRVHRAEREGGNLLGDMANELAAKIEMLETRRRDLEGGAAA